jgi:mannose-6-phosphate isomerase-like protein (cupin superfamily)
MTIIKVSEVTRLNRGGGVSTVPLITRHSDDTALITTGMSTYPVGSGAPLHTHNCDEQVTLLSGVGECEVDGVATALEPYDSTYIPAGVQHLFRNTGDEPMTILWIYPTQRVTRTMIETGETVEHLSDRDMMGSDD